MSRDEIITHINYISQSTGIVFNMDTLIYYDGSDDGLLPYYIVSIQDKRFRVGLYSRLDLPIETIGSVFIRYYRKQDEDEAQFYISIISELYNLVDTYIFMK